MVMCQRAGALQGNCLGAEHRQPAPDAIIIAQVGTAELPLTVGQLAAPPAALAQVGQLAASWATGGTACSLGASWATGSTACSLDASWDWSVAVRPLVSAPGWTPALWHTT